MKKTEVTEVRNSLKKTLERFLGPLKVKVDTESNFELSGTIQAPQGKKMVDGIYFSSIVPKEKDVRFYFFPAYTHPEAFEYISDRLKKFKKGKSCFHVSYLDEELENEIKEMISKAIDIYRTEGWLA